MERIFQQTQTLGAETSAKVNDLFRQKVQLEDQLIDVEAQIHYARGVLDTVGEMQTFIRRTQKQDADKLKYDRDAEEYAKAHPGGDGSKDPAEIPSSEVTS